MTIALFFAGVGLRFAVLGSKVVYGPAEQLFQAFPGVLRLGLNEHQHAAHFRGGNARR